MLIIVYFLNAPNWKYRFQDSGFLSLSLKVFSTENKCLSRPLSWRVEGGICPQETGLSLSPVVAVFLFEKLSFCADGCPGFCSHLVMKITFVVSGGVLAPGPAGSLINSRVAASKKIILIKK